MDNLLTSMRNDMLSGDAMQAAEEYMRNSEKIRELENRQFELLSRIKNLFDHQYNLKQLNS